MGARSRPGARCCCPRRRGRRFRYRLRLRVRHHPRMRDPGPPPPEWPPELARRIACLAAASDPAPRDGPRVAVWTLLRQALARFLRGFARRAGRPDDVAIEDLLDEM